MTSLNHAPIFIKERFIWSHNFELSDVSGCPLQKNNPKLILDCLGTAMKLSDYMVLLDKGYHLDNICMDDETRMGLERLITIQDIIDG